MATIDPAASWNEESWSVNGVSLHKQGWSITTVGGSRYDLPPKRGSNMAVAYRPGQVHRNKIPDARTITLLMFMIGAPPDTGIVPGINPTLDNQRVQWNDNWDYLRRTVLTNYQAGGRVTLTRRWRLTAPDFPATRVGDAIMAGDPGTAPPNVSRIVTASSYGEMTGNMAPSMTGRTRADFQLDFTLADPFFYGPAVSTTQSRSSSGFYVWNDGHDVAAHAGLTVQFNAGEEPLVNPILTNVSTNPDVYLKFSGTINRHTSVICNIGAFTCYAFNRSTPTVHNNYIKNVASSGGRFWMSLLPGANKLVFAASGGSDATCTFTFQPPYW